MSPKVCLPAALERRWRGPSAHVQCMMQMCIIQHWEFMDQHHRQHEGTLRHLDRQAEQDRLLEECMLEAMHTEEMEDCYVRGFPG